MDELAERLSQFKLGNRRAERIDRRVTTEAKASDQQDETDREIETFKLSIKSRVVSSFHNFDSSLISKFIFTDFKIITIECFN